jgi:hypothetical protein
MAFVIDDDLRYDSLILILISAAAGLLDGAEGQDQEA